ncbi:hypothetical protein OSB04_014072 [Centaurea solstitialis]|uniref:Protein kinase domain-containing protein n=1 Tax=Centaurea solstitialis TaxID=347529 RepID=A0AA38TM03_9ASTR|nr:hypothetical protein OSB04_014072 [Centaurea solstitialis]
MSSIKEFDHLKIPLQDIISTTNNFGDNSLIGRGGFGKVYRGELLMSEGLTTVAIKRLDSALGQGAPEFWKEIMMLSRYKHENLVSLLGFCDESGEKILVYEYLPNKSLDLYLSRSDLSWIQRLRICIGAARGLQYLHDPDGTQQRVLHRDIKSSNILLDENWKAKISDFGLSKFGPANQQFTFLVSNAVGTIGYCDPLYVQTGFLTKESDVYSFGVVLFEVLCGRLCVQNYEDIRRFLVGLAQERYEEKNLDTIIDASLKEQISPKCLEIFSKVAYQCLRMDRIERPSAIEIVKELETALQCQENPESIEIEASRRLWVSSLHVNSASSSRNILEYEIMWADLIIMEKLGKGSDEIVYHALWNGSDVAVKVFASQEKYAMQSCINEAQGMSYLHGCNPPIVHCELKSSNLLVDKNWTVKPEWMAPEILRDEPVNEKADVYSYGVILWEITTEKIPWEGLNPAQVVAAVGFKAKRLEIPKDVDPLWASLIKSCWRNEPWSRPTFQEILNTLKSLERKLKVE